MSFDNFIFSDSLNKIFFKLILPGIVIQFVLFKYFYPFAGYINGDSYVYLETAYHNLAVNTYPIGYSKFLRFISVFTTSDTVVVAIQYLLLQTSTFFLMFSLFYFYRPLTLTKVILYVVVMFNPVYLYLANYISSDALFLSLSMTWFAMLIWIMNKPSVKLVVINSLLLFAAFSVRYNALFYPIISIVALILTRKKIWLNIGGFMISAVLIMIFAYSTSTSYKKISGHRQFTPFSGWQLANNALYAYRFVSADHVQKVPTRFNGIDSLVRAYFDSTRDVRMYPQERVLAGTSYMWIPNSPLTIYMNNQFKSDSAASALKKWATVAPMMEDYGRFLIHTYPKEFALYFLLPNAIKYYAPPVEFLGYYSTGVDSVNYIAQVWFDYKTKKISTRFKDFEVNSLKYYPVLVGMMNIIFLFGILSFVLLHGHRYFPELKRGLVLVGVLWMVNLGFSVFASAIALRFQLFPILVSLFFNILLIDFLVRASRGNFATIKHPEDVISLWPSTGSVQHDT